MDSGRLAVAVSQLERRVRHCGQLLFVNQVILAADILAARHHAAPDSGQGRQDRTVAVALLQARCRHTRQRLGQAGEIGKQIVEAAVFQVDHDHVLDVGAQLGVERAPGRRLRRSGRCACDTGQRAGAGHHASGRGGLEDAPARGVAWLGGRVRSGILLVHVLLLSLAVKATAKQALSVSFTKGNKQEKTNSSGSSNGCHI